MFFLFLITLKLKTGFHKISLNSTTIFEPDLSEISFFSFPNTFENSIEVTISKEDKTQAFHPTGLNFVVKNVTQISITCGTTVNIEVWLLPVKLCNDGITSLISFPKKAHAQIIFHSYSYEKSQCIIPLSSTYEQKVDLMSRNLNSYIYTESSLKTMEPFSSAENATVNDISLSEPFIFVVVPKILKPGFSFKSQLSKRYSGECNFQSIEQFSLDKLSPNTNEYLINCNENPWSGWMFVAFSVGLLIAVIFIGYGFVVCCRKWNKFKHEEIIEIAHTDVNSVPLLTQEINRNDKISISQMSSRNENIVFFERNTSNK